MKDWIIAGHSIAPGYKKQVMIEPNVEGYEMPATLVYGEEDGMTLVVTGGIHSGEYPGVAAAIRLGKEISPVGFKGRLLLIHSVNTSGFWAKSPGRVPEDGVNLNADYPGKADGTTGQRIADFFVKEIFPQTDFIVDLHSGGGVERLTPCLFFPAAAGDRVCETALKAAKATNIPYLIASVADSGQYSYAAKKFSIPGLLMERGHSDSCKKEWVDDYCNDLYRLLIHFGMYENEDIAPACKKTICNETIYLRSEQKGLWYPAIEEGQHVKEGQLLGHIEDFFGQLLGEYHAEDDGLVFYFTDGLAVHPGDALVAYGLSAHMK